MFNLRQTILYFALAASSTINVPAVAAMGSSAQQDNVLAPLPSEGMEQPTSFDSSISSMLLKRSAIPADGLINTMPKRDVGFGAMAGLLRRNILDMVKRSDCNKDAAGGQVVVAEDEEEEGESHMLLKRQSLGTIDATGWDGNVTDSCMKAMKAVPSNTTNPSGMMACYNVPYLNAMNGTFLSELRLYQMGEPDDAWASVGSRLSVNVQYTNAMVQLQGQNKRKRSLAKRQADSNAEGNSTSEDSMAMKVFNFAGKINDDALPGNGEDRSDREAIIEAMKEVLMPQITLMGVGSDGTVMNVSLSGDEVTYVSGVFAKAAAQNATLPAVPEKFVLPGTAIEVNPVGLYLTAAYTLLFLIIILYGTFERRKHRDLYRKRMARDMKNFSNKAYKNLSSI